MLVEEGHVLECQDGKWMEKCFDPPSVPSLRCCSRHWRNDIQNFLEGLFFAALRRRSALRVSSARSTRNL